MNEDTLNSQDESMRRLMSAALAAHRLRDDEVESLLRESELAHTIRDEQVRRIAGKVARLIGASHEPASLTSSTSEGAPVISHGTLQSSQPRLVCVSTMEIPQRSHRNAAIASLLASLLALMSVVVFTANTPVQPTMSQREDVRGNANLLRADLMQRRAMSHASRFQMTAKPLTESPPIVRVGVGDEISTGEFERRRVTLPDGSVLFVNCGSQVKIATKRRVEVSQGEVFVEVVPEFEASESRRFEVVTPKRIVSALGTKFAVKVNDEETDVMVTQGKVKISGVDQIVMAGKQFRVAGDTILTTATSASAQLEWTRDLLATATGPLVAKSEYSGGALVTVDPNGQSSKLSLRNYYIDVHIEDGFARTTIDQTYFNHTHSRLEGTFHFPLPTDASLSRLAMYVNGKLMEGGMAERDHARNTFEEIKLKMLDPALLEWVDGSTFKMRVFPLEPRQEKRIILSYSQRLASSDGQLSYRFPAGHTMDAVRNWSAHMVVKSAAGCDWNSQSHGMEASDSDGDLVLDAAMRNALLDKDLVLTVAEKIPSPPGKGEKVADRPDEGAAFDKTSLSPESGERRQSPLSSFTSESQKYLMLRLRPDLAGDMQRKPHHWVFLFEHAGDRTPLLARAQIEIIRTLLNNAEHSDTFSIVTASSRAAMYADEPQLCSAENVTAAVKHLENVHLVGALDLTEGLKLCRTAFSGRPDKNNSVRSGPDGPTHPLPMAQATGIDSQEMDSPERAAEAICGELCRAFSPLGFFATLPGPHGPGIGYVGPSGPESQAVSRGAIVHGGLTPNRSPVLVHVGSAMPAIGERDAAKLAELIPSDVEYVGIGVGRRWNEAMMKQAASRTGGLWTQINPDEEIAWRAFDVFHKLHLSRLVNVKVVPSPPGKGEKVAERPDEGAVLDTAPMKERKIAESQSPLTLALFPESGERGQSQNTLQFLLFSNVISQGEELAAICRIPEGQPLPKEITVTATLNGQPWTQTIAVENVKENASYLPRHWAKLEIDRLLAENAAENREAIIALSKSMYVMSPFTSLLVLENDEMYTQFNVDRGRKDHWALYACPETIEVVVENGGDAAVPAESKTTNDVKTPADVMSTVVRLPGATYIPMHTITLTKMDPTAAVQTLRNLYSSLGSAAPEFQADLATNRIVVSGTADQVLQSRQVISQLEGNHQVDGNHRRRIRYVPLNSTNYMDGLFAMNGRARSPATVRYPDYTLRGSADFFGDGQGEESRRWSADQDRHVYSSNASMLFEQQSAISDFLPPQLVHGKALNTGSGIQFNWNNRWFESPPDDEFLHGDPSAANNAVIRQSNGGLPSRYDFSIQDTLRGSWPRYDVLSSEETSFEGFFEIPSSFRARQMSSPAEMDDLAVIRMSQLEEQVNVPVPAGLGPMVISSPVELEVRRKQMLQEGELVILKGNVGDVAAVELMLRALESGAGEIPDDYASFQSQVRRQMLWDDSAGDRRYLRLSGNQLRLEPADLADPQRIRRGRNRLHNFAAYNPLPKVKSDKQVSHRWAAARYGSDELVTLPTFQAPVANSIIANPTLFGDLLSHAPGLNTSTADVMAVVEAEAGISNLKFEISNPPAGRIDDAARELIEKARSRGWESIAIPGRDGEAGITVVYDGTGRHVWERIVSEGLREHVVCDGETLWHVYREIGLASKRPFSRFHHREFSNIVPWLLPSVEELSRGADIVAVDERTVAIVPVSGSALAAGEDKNSKSQISDLKSEEQLPAVSAVPLIHLVFADDGRLAERRIIELEGSKVLRRITYETDGSVKVLDGNGKELAAAKFDRSIAAEPQLIPDLDGLIALPMPVRKPEVIVARTTKIDGKGEYDANLSEDDALALMLAYMAKGDGTRVVEIARTRFIEKGDTRDGLYVLLSRFPNELVRAATPADATPGAIQTPGFDLRPSVEGSALKKFVRQYVNWRLDTAAWQPGAGGISAFQIDAPADSFLQHMARARNLYVRWLTDEATKDLTQTQVQQEVEKSLDFIGTCRTLDIGWALISTMRPRLTSPEHLAAFAKAAERFEQHPQVGLLVRQERMATLLTAGKHDEAMTLFKEWLSVQLQQGRVPPIGKPFYDSLTANNYQQTVNDFLLTEANQLANSGLLMTLNSFAVQMRELGNTKLAEQMMTKLLATLDTHERPDVSLYAIEQLRQMKDARADKLLDQVMELPLASQIPQLWRFAAKLAEESGRKRLAAERLEHALQLEFATRPTTINIETVRHDYAELLTKFDELITAAATLEVAPPDGLAASIIQAADQWRTLDKDDTAACQTASRLLAKLNRTDAAWDYLITPLSENSGESAPWIALAKTLGNDQQIDLADMAWRRAFEFETTNPEILLEHAILLQAAGRTVQAKAVLQRVADESWQPRFSGTIQKIKELLQAM